MAAMTLEMHKEMMEMKGRVSNGEAKWGEVDDYDLPLIPR
jgi:hypothetical protein